MAPKRYLTFTLVTTLLTGGIFGIIAACSEKGAKAKPAFTYKDQAPHPGIVAKVFDSEITEEQLMGDAKLKFLELKKREYELKMERVTQLLRERVIGSAAKDAGMTTEEFTKKKILAGEIKISPAEFAKFLKDKNVSESQVNPQLKERIMEFLKEQHKEDKIEEFVAKASKGKTLEVYFTRPKLQINVDVGSAPTQGPADAPVTLVAFSDFQCPFCSKGANVMHEIKQKYGSKVRIAFKHFPLSFHPDAKPAAEVAMCVNEQGNDKFWKYHDIAFKNQKKLDVESLKKYGTEAGANAATLKTCVDSKKYANAIQTDIDYGMKLGVQSTPTFFVNGELVSGAVPLDQFSEVIDEALREHKKM